MVKIKWLENAIRRIEEKPISSIVSFLTFCVIALVNWKWLLPFPFYDLEEMSVIGFAATMSWVAFAGTEVAGMFLMSLTKDKMRAEADARVSAAKEAAAAAREEAAAAREEAARERAARIEAEARAEKPNGAEAAAKAASEAAAKAVAEAMAIVASEREKDREIILANQETIRLNQETIRSNQETIRDLVRQLAETRGGTTDAGFGCV